MSTNWVSVVFVYQRGTKWCVCLHDNERLSSVREAVKEVIGVAHRRSVSDRSKSEQVLLLDKCLFRLLRQRCAGWKWMDFTHVLLSALRVWYRSAHVQLLETWTTAGSVASERFRVFSADGTLLFILGFRLLKLRFKVHIMFISIKKCPSRYNVHFYEPVLNEYSGLMLKLRSYLSPVTTENIFGSSICKNKTCWQQCT